MVDFANPYTGEVLPFPTPFSYVDEERYKETTSDEYLVDDTGYVTLEEQIRRCFRERRIVDEAPGLDDEFVDGLPGEDEDVEELPETSDNSELSPDGGDLPVSEPAVDNLHDNEALEQAEK